MSDHSEQNLDYERGREGPVEVHSAVKREKADPKTGLEPVSIWAFIIASLILVLGGAYVGAYSGGFSNANTIAVPNYVAAKRPLEDGETQGPTGPWIDRWLKAGKANYASCAGCHGADGKGQPGVFPPLADSDWVSGGTARVVAVVSHGLQGPITVNGAPYNNVMPMLGMDDKKIAQVVSYIRDEFAGGASVVTEEMVKNGREQYASRPGAFTMPDLEALYPDPNEMLPGAEVDLETGEPIGGAAE